MGTHRGVALTQFEIKHMINSSTVLNKPSSFEEQKYQQKLLLNSLALWVELHEALFSGVWGFFCVLFCIVLCVCLFWVFCVGFFVCVYVGGGLNNYLLIRIMPSPHHMFSKHKLS